MSDRALDFDAEGVRQAAARLCVDVCRVLDIARCSVYLREPGRETFIGFAAHPAADLEFDVTKMRIGGRRDVLTRAVTDSGVPVFVRDARSDPRTAGAAVRRFGVRTILGLPLHHAGVVIGVAWVDNATRSYPYRPEQMATAAALADAAGDAIGRASDARRLQVRLQNVARQNQLLRDATKSDDRLSRIALSGGGVGAIVNAVADITRKPTALYDAACRTVARATAPGDSEEVGVQLLDAGRRRAAALPLVAALGPGTCRPVEPQLNSGLQYRHLVAPITVSGRIWGHLVVMERGSRLTALDEHATRRAALHLALELAAQERATVGTREARSAVAQQLLRGGADLDGLRRQTAYLGIPIDAPWIVVRVHPRAPEPGALDGGALARAVASGTGGVVLETRVAGDVVLLVEVASGRSSASAVEHVRSAVTAACAREPGAAGVAVGLSTLCRHPGRVPRGHAEATEVVRCMARTPASSAPGVLAADDIGPARLLLLNSDATAIEDFVADVLGPLLNTTGAAGGLLLTAHHYFDCARSVRRCSARLGIHENTVRQRLERFKAITGLDVAADPQDQLTVQMALLIARVRGLPGLPPFGARGGV